MSGHASFGWVLLVLGLVIAGVGLVWILAPSIPWLVPVRIFELRGDFHVF